MKAQIVRTLILGDSLHKATVKSPRVELPVCPACVARRKSPFIQKLKEWTAILSVLLALLAVLTICTGILCGFLKYAADETNRSFYEMNRNSTVSDGR